MLFPVCTFPLVLEEVSAQLTDCATMPDACFPIVMDSYLSGFSPNKIFLLLVGLFIIIIIIIIIINFLDFFVDPIQI